MGQAVDYSAVSQSPSKEFLREATPSERCERDAPKRNYHRFWEDAPSECLGRRGRNCGLN